MLAKAVIKIVIIYSEASPVPTWAERPLSIDEAITPEEMSKRKKKSRLHVV